jgi:S1-C subfamily serine protease
MSCHRLIPILFLLAAIAVPAVAAEPAADFWESPAKKLQQATVTVRIWGPKSDAKTQPANVTVCSGLCVRNGFIITAAFAASDSPIRLTLPGGKQVDAKVQAIDEYSGLVLLKADTAALTPLTAADELPAVGAELLTAAAWGLDQPLVSRGIVGAVDRKLQSLQYPPLLQSDCLTTSTSTGAGLVDRHGRLAGVIVATDMGGDRRGWAYAVPVSHVERLLHAADQHQADGILILKRRRPVVGMVLDQDGAGVVVARVTPGGPAEKAGIQPGDQISMTDGVVIRSVYQAVLPTLYKQPGDTTTFRVHRDESSRDISVVLGGGVEVALAPFDLLADLVQPKIHMSRDEKGAIVTNKTSSKSAQVALLPPLPNDAPPPTPPTSADKITLLEKALNRYQAVIELQQKQLESLRAELESLRTPKPAPAAK